ncbi:MAG: hypothetical protein Q9162_006337 [Coniocarpon cinnabarinum]
MSHPGGDEPSKNAKHLQKMIHWTREQDSSTLRFTNPPSSSNSSRSSYEQEPEAPVASSSTQPPKDDSYIKTEKNEIVAKFDMSKCPRDDASPWKPQKVEAKLRAALQEAKLFQGQGEPTRNDGSKGEKTLELRVPKSIYQQSKGDRDKIDALAQQCGMKKVWSLSRTIHFEFDASKAKEGT